ncbi:MAG: DUF3160 domain-containing protein [Butyrivibrio sp.]|nr:DUF3160 domain-containing protein [Butyrivibrio sp.]
MKKRVVSAIIALSMLTVSCGSTEIIVGDESGSASSNLGAPRIEDNAVAGSEGPISFMGEEEEIYYDKDLVPSIPAYAVASDLSNVKYVPDLEGMLNMQYEDEETHRVSKLRNALAQNGFAVVNSNASEFYWIYESNRYGLIPHFVTVDSLMHTYHLYFAYLLKHTEKDYLDESLKKLSKDMVDVAFSQYSALKGTEWEKAALRNIEFFGVGSELLNEKVTTNLPDSEAKNTILAETEKVTAAENIDDSLITGIKEDYTQYKARGYYEGDEQLEQYFRAMMWYGRMAFEFDDPELVKSAALMTIALSDSPELWQKIYSVTSFFAGSADDITYEQMAEAIKQSYGSMPDAKTMASDKASFDKLMSSLKTLDKPQVNSIPVNEGEDSVIPSFRFMGQRFTIDAAIMQNLVYSAVEENEEGERRYLPDVLDTPAALGSEKAKELLEQKGAMAYDKYGENLDKVSEHFNNMEPALWNASLYSSWLNTLRPLLTVKGEGYPSFMQNDAWVRKDLESFAGSYAELKHDTVLYAKQTMAEMGGGTDEKVDDRGYVQPEPVIYSRFINLSERTKDGLDKLGMIKDSDKENLERLTMIAKKFLTMSEKELKNETLSDEEYEFIRNYGGDLEHFWIEVHSDSPDATLSSDDPCRIITDIASDPNGSVLEIGTGGADTIYVVFPIDGELHVGRGSVFSFYQFEQPISERLTDSEWNNLIMGGYINDSWDWVEVKGSPEKPDWTMDYRVDD